MEYYVITSLELHLFFGRIMKEHALFLELGYTPADDDFKKEAKAFQLAFEDLLKDAVESSEGVVPSNVLDSGEVITEYTLPSEMTTSRLSGSSINTDITKMEIELMNNNNQSGYMNVDELATDVRNLNQRCLSLLDNFIKFKMATLNNVLNCHMYTTNYPLLIEHIIREAQLYQRYIMQLEEENGFIQDDLKDVELFWNQIMMEHALFIRGLLDPSENELIVAANDFAGDYAQLIADANNMTQRTMDSVTNKTLDETIKYRDFKATGTKGINQCEIKSLILPLLADHVLREANHYVRILQEMDASL